MALLSTDPKLSPKQICANELLQGRPTHLLSRSPPTDLASIPARSPASDPWGWGWGLRFHFKRMRICPWANAWHLCPHPPIQHIGPGERGPDCRAGGREAWGSPRKCSSFSLSFFFWPQPEANHTQAAQHLGEFQEAGSLTGTKDEGLVDTLLPHPHPPPAPSLWPPALTSVFLGFP